MKENAHGLAGVVNRWILKWQLDRVKCVVINGVKRNFISQHIQEQQLT